MIATLTPLPSSPLRGNGRRQICVAILLEAARALMNGGEYLAVPSALLIPNVANVRHGSSSGLPDGTVELIAVVMAAVGTGQASEWLLLAYLLTSP